MEELSERGGVERRRGSEDVGRWSGTHHDSAPPPAKWPLSVSNCAGESVSESRFRREPTLDVRSMGSSKQRGVAAEACGGYLRCS